jgi:hypothetical protein
MLMRFRQGPFFDLYALTSWVNQHPHVLRDIHRQRLLLNGAVKKLFRNKEE